MDQNTTLSPTMRLSGDALAKGIKQSVAEAAARMTAAGVQPKMAVILASEDAASLSYAQAKKKTAAQLGIELEIHDLGKNVTQAGLLDTCRSLSARPGLHGILLELPLAASLNANEALDHIIPAKDIDGMTSSNLGLIAADREQEALTSATAQACLLLAESQGAVAGKRVAIIGRGRTVGRPLAGMLVNRHATVTVCHTRTPNLRETIAGCDLVFVAIGRARQITGEHLHAGQVVIDAGINFQNGKLVGDVDGESVQGVVAALTPVPGGVGPVTSALIFQNLICAVRKLHPELP